MRRKKPSQFEQGAWNDLLKPGLRDAIIEASRRPIPEYSEYFGPPRGLDPLSGLFHHSWPTDQTCPTCQGHCEIFTGTYYEGEAISYTCTACDGQGVMLWMMPSTKQQERRMEKFLEELIPLDGL